MNKFCDVNEDANKMTGRWNKTHEHRKKKHNSIDCKQMRWRLNGFQECWLHFYVCVFSMCLPMNIQIRISVASQILAVCLLSLVVVAFILVCCAVDTTDRGQSCMSVCLTHLIFEYSIMHLFVHTVVPECANPKAIWMYKIANVCTLLYMQCTHTNTCSTATMLF